MASYTNWLSLTDLGRIYGISAIHCGKTLQREGLRDHNGYPTPRALKVGAAYTNGQNNPPRATVWNSEICQSLFEKTGYQPINHSSQIEKWVDLLHALEEGSPAISATPAQMAEDLPEEFIGEVNKLLAERGCNFRATKK